MSRDDLPADLPRRDATPRDVFFDRRTFMRTAAAAVIAPAACAEQSGPLFPPEAVRPPIEWPDGFAFRRSEAHEYPSGLARRQTPRAVAATHNNYYEFLYGRGGSVWKHTDAFEVSPWQVEVTGECAKPTTLDLDDLLRFPHEERLSHFRCVERWAMNVPWCGFPLRALLERVEPNGNARYVRFVTVHRPEQMPGLRQDRRAAGGVAWPYHEGLRMDEAMHDLAFVATGVYGEPLLKQHRAPVRLVVPWKYGYKSPKSIVKVELVREQPPTFWSRGAYGHEYGFLSNVNPSIPHPRWSQAVSYWLDTRENFATPIFNGYDQAVGALYPDEPRTMQVPLRPGQKAR